MPFQRSKDGRFSGGPAKSPRKSPRKSPAPPPAKKRKLETPSSSKQTLQGGEKEIVEGRKSRGRPKLSLPSPRVPKTPGTDKSPIKTRRILNSKKTNPHCTLCKKARKEELKTCGTCELSYHLSHCLRMSENQAEKTYEMDDWTCPKCIRCSACEGIIDDCTNVECSVCQSAWHGDCFKGKDEGKDTVCKKCRGRGGTHSPVLARTPSTSATSTSAPSSTWKKGRPSLPGGPRKLPKGYVMISESVMHGGDVPSSSNNPETEAIEEILNSRARVWDNLVEEFQKQQSLPNSPLKRDRSKSRSPEKKPPQQLPRLSLQKISTHEDYDLFQSALRQLNQETASSRKASSTNTTSIGKWVYFGDSPKMKALYASPYPEDVLAGGSIFVCPYCMNSTGRADTYRIHMQNCEFRHPPGNEIYREGTLSFFEVDGAAQRLYCRSLCLLSKMFISSKTLHHEVETFLFYILTDNTAQGCRMVAYFSKEKNPSKNNNLSCLLTLPGQNRKGYGKLLIDLSYELSRLEHKIGSPEHPLSDLGLFAYRGYWRASILQHLRSLHHSQSTSIKSIALATRINPSDVINQLLRDKLLAYVDGNYFIKTGKRAYKWPLSFFRRRMIDKSKLVWKPGNDVTDLDPNYSKKRNVLVITYKKECGVLVSESESNCPDFDAPLSFVDCHRENRRWQQFVHSDLKLADGHISTVDAIRLFRRNGQRFCISGSRDRSMKIWDLARIQQGGSSKQWEVTKKDAAHGGWIWYIDTPRDDTFFSSGWDDYLKQWQITPDGLVEMGSLKLRSAVTSSIKMQCGLVACSTYAKQISFVDPQDAFRIHQACTFHRAAIITMDVQGDKVYSCGDDKQMIVTDVRMPDKPYLIMKATQDSVQSISVGHGQVVCGTKKGAVKIYEPITMSLITSYRPKPAVQIRQVKHNRGSVIAMWKTQLVKIFTSGTKARVRAETREIGEPSRFDYLKGDFAICGGLGSIMFWPCPEDVGY